MIDRNILALVTTGDWTSWVKMQVKITRMLMISTITILLFGSFVSCSYLENNTSEMSPSTSTTGFTGNRSMIVFESDRDGNTEIYIMNTDGSNLKNLSQNKARDWNPKVYPDNKKIVFMSDRDDNWEIYIMNFDGSNQINLSNNPRTDFSFSFLPLPN